MAELWQTVIFLRLKYPLSSYQNFSYSTNYSKAISQWEPVLNNLRRCLHHNRGETFDRILYSYQVCASVCYKEIVYLLAFRELFVCFPGNSLLEKLDFSPMRHFVKQMVIRNNGPSEQWAPLDYYLDSNVLKPKHVADRIVVFLAYHLPARAQILHDMAGCITGNYRY